MLTILKKHFLLSLTIFLATVLLCLPIQTFGETDGNPPDMNNLPDEDMRRNIEKMQQNMQQRMQGGMQKKMRNQQRRKVQDRLSGFPAEVIAKQSSEKVEIPLIKKAIEIGLAKASEKALSLIDTDFHKNGNTINVPDDHTSIQAALNAAESGDTVLVKAGTYYEQLIMKDGVRLISDASENGNDLLAFKNAHLKMPRRTLRTIIDGSKAKPSKHGMIDFDPGVGRKSIIDGFTIQNLPLQDHHIPGHAHGLNVRGASPVITNCLIQNMGSTGIGSHVVYYDQDSPGPRRDFREENIKHQASAVLYNNIIHGSTGLGIGCNHFSSPSILGNEMFNNTDSSLGGTIAPGLGIKHGAAPLVMGNILHDNPGGGILTKEGAPQGRHRVNRKPHPTISYNIIFDNGEDKPGITGRSAGELKAPIIIEHNFV